MEAFSREPNKESPLDTLLYEIRMLRHAYLFLSKHGPSHQPKDELNVYIECYLVHFRNLINFLSGGGKKNDFRIDRPQKWSPCEISKNQLNTLKQASQDLRVRYSATISKFLTHCTSDRHMAHQAWDIAAMNTEIEQRLIAFEQLIGKPQKDSGRPKMNFTDSFGTATTRKFGL